MGNRFNKLFQPIKLASVTIENRIVMSPMQAGGLTNPDGTLTQRCIDYYTERAKGGTGLLITGGQRVENEVEKLIGIVAIPSPPSLLASPSYGELAESVHYYGSKLFIQLQAGFGRVLLPPLVKTGIIPLSSSSFPAYWKPSVMTRAMTKEEIKGIVEGFGRVARVLADAGIDGIEILGHEGYLLDQFATAAWNKRTDEYGGDLEGRLRFPIEALRAVKDAVGEDFPVIYQYGLKHYMKGNWPGPWSGILPGEKSVEAGRDIDEGLEMAKFLEKVGFDALHIDAGCYDSWYWAHPPVYQKHGCLADLAARVKKVVNIPVITVGRIDIPELANRILENDEADMIGLGRALLADPYWPKKVREGNAADIRPCIGCHYCLMRIVNENRPLSCAVNPSVGRERLYENRPANKAKRIMVIGGGVAGMEAARVAAKMGHKVTLYEGSNALGGHLLAAGVPDFKKDLERLCDWYRTQINELGLRVNLNTQVTPDLVKDERPDAVIVATGSKPIIPDIPGITESSVSTCIDVLLGIKKAGERIVVVGGGLVGCETALWLAQQGKKVAIVEMLSQVATDAFHANRVMLLDMLAFNNVNIITNTKVGEITDEGVVIIGDNKRKRTLEGDTVVLAVGMKSERGLYDSLRSEIAELYTVGDCKEPRMVEGAIWDSFHVAHAICSQPI